MTKFFDTPEAAVENATKEAENSGDCIAFDDDGCDDFCSGWDGKSYRCSCGNRRLYWATFQNANGKYYAEATTN